MVKLKNPNEVNSATTENFQEEKLDELDTDEISDILGNPFDDTSKKSPTDTLITTVTTKRGKKVTMPRSWTIDRFVSKILSNLSLKTILPSPKLSSLAYAALTSLIFVAAHLVFEYNKLLYLS